MALVVYLIYNKEKVSASEIQAPNMPCHSMLEKDAPVNARSRNQRPLAYLLGLPSRRGDLIAVAAAYH
jgi:hypothetical protein